MAAEQALNPEPANACCTEVFIYMLSFLSSPFSPCFAYCLALLFFFFFVISQWKKKCSKLQESRNALRQAVKLLERRINDVEAQNVNLNKGEINSEPHHMELFGV